MHTVSKKFLIALGLSAASLLAQAAPINLISNGSFESVSVANGSWATLGSLAGWTVGPQQVELRNNVAGSAFAGLNFVELDTNRNSWISQTFTTVAGASYHLSFMWANRPDHRGAASNGISWQFGALSGVVGDNAVTAWTKFERDFVATDSSTTLRFAAMGSGDGMGTSLDAVSVTSKVPEPTSLALLAAAGVGALCLGRRRKA